MRHSRTFSVLAVLAALTLWTAPAAHAQDLGLMVAAFGGAGGSPDTDSYSGTGFQLLAAMELSHKTITGLRIGGLTVEPTDLGVETDLTYINIGTEYRRDADYYESGLLIGLGYYQLDATDEESIGLSLGATGEFVISPHWSVLVELTGHYADFDTAQIFLMAHGGIAFRF